MVLKKLLILTDFFEKKAKKLEISIKLFYTTASL